MLYHISVYSKSFLLPFNHIYTIDEIINKKNMSTKPSFLITAQKAIVFIKGNVKAS